MIARHLARNYAEVAPEAVSGSPSLPGFKLKQVTDWIEEHLDDGFDLERLAPLSHDFLRHEPDRTTAKHRDNLAALRPFLGFVFVLFRLCCGGIGVHCRFGEFGELRVGFLFLIERFLEEFSKIVVTEASREGAGGAVAGDFVMLDALRRADEAGIANALFRIFIDQLRALFDQAFHGFACVPGELFAKLLADLREPLDVPFGLLEVFFEAGFELWICRGLRHLRERFDELVFSAVEVFEFVKEEIF
jgi:hypothetical protein